MTPTHLHLFAWFELRKQGGIDEPCWVVETFERDDEDFRPTEDDTPSETIELWCPRIFVSQPDAFQAFLQAEEPGEYAHVVFPIPLDQPLVLFEVHADPWVITGKEVVE